MTFSDRLTVGCLVSNPPGGRKQAAVYFFSPHKRLAPVRTPVSEKCPNQPAIALSYFLCGHLAPLSRRPYQPENRFSSVSRPLLNVSGAASPRFTGTDSTKLQRSACAGSNYVWIMCEKAGSCAGAEWEVNEKNGNGGEGGCVIA